MSLLVSWTRPFPQDGNYWLKNIFLINCHPEERVWITTACNYCTQCSTVCLISKYNRSNFNKNLAIAMKQLCLWFWKYYSWKLHYTQLQHSHITYFTFKPGRLVIWAEQRTGMKANLLLLLITVVCPLAYAARIDIPGYGEYCNDCV